MKKLLISLLFACVAVGASAQFSQGTKYIGASFTNLGMSYSKNNEFRFGINLEGGYYVADCWMARAYAGYEHAKHVDDVYIGAGVRYHFYQNGIFLGAGLEYDHITKSNNDLLIPVEVGYTFYLNHYLAIEPSVYYKMSTNDFADGSTVGLRIGLGYFF